MTRDVTILGAGLVGSLLAVIFRKRGYEVSLYDRRPDVRNVQTASGRSINLTISARGWKALELAGLKNEIGNIAIPMYGRILHQADGNNVFQPYSKNHEAIYSISRNELNKKLVGLAEESGAAINFETHCIHIDVPDNIVHFELPDKSTGFAKANLLFGADGASSALRESYTRLDGVACSRKSLEYGYKELTINSGTNGEWLLEKNALHIWPRNNYMMIAMPNNNGSFTCTLFMPYDGDESFAKLQTGQEVTDFFEMQFPDAKKYMPRLEEEFFANGTGLLVTTNISKWHHENKSALIGDAAHTIVPFYGQGMNAGFEDCTILSELMDKMGNDWERIFSEYELLRKPAGDAVAQLAMYNFIEIRDKVVDPVFLERKKIEKELAKRFPTQFVPIYEMVSFSHTPYDKVIRCIQLQDNLLQKVMDEGDFFININDSHFSGMLVKWIDEYNNAIR